MTEDEERTNRGAVFIPMDDVLSRPTLDVGGAYVWAYWEDGKLHVSVGLEDTDDRFCHGDDGLVPVCIDVNGVILFDTDDEGVPVPVGLPRLKGE